MTTVRLHELDVNAAELITNALRNLLSLASTQQTIAQIIDDMPIQGHYYGLNSSARYPDPDIERRPAPSDNATQVAQRLCSEFDLSTVAIKAKSTSVKPKTAEKFQSELQLSPNSSSVAHRFLEIISGLIHDIASNIYLELHPVPPEFDVCREARLEHRAYIFWGAYKHKHASPVGYWAEADIFGGPILFAKGTDGTGCSAAFMHLTEPNICAPTKIVQLNEEQVNSFMVYASRVGDRPPTETSGVPLPFGVNSDARRLTIEQAVSENIYREYGQLSREWESNRLYMIR